MRHNPGLQGASDTIRDSSGSSTGIRPDTTTQLGETWESLKEFRNEVIAQKNGRSMEAQGLEVQGIHGDGGPSRGPVKEEAGGR